MGHTGGRWRVGLLATVIASVGCSNPLAPTGDISNSNGTTLGQTLALTIDGEPFQPAYVLVANVPAFGPLPETLAISASGLVGGRDPSRGVTIQVPNRVGKYDIRSTPYPAVVLQRTSSPDAYSEADSANGSGWVEITSRTANTAEGRLDVHLSPAGQFGGGGSTCAGTFSVRF